MRTPLLFLAALGAAFLVSASTASDALAGPRGRHGRHHRLPPGLRALVLEKFDANGDGKLDETERQAAREAFAAKRAERRAEIIAKFDADGDGRLDQAERQAARSAMREKIRERRQERRR